MKSSPQLEQGMRQSMVATAAMQLYLRALQATQMELSQLTTQALNTNPALEEEPLPQRPAPEHDDDTHAAPDYEATRRHDALLDSLPQQKTLHDHLQEQVLQSALPPELEKAALRLIGQLDAHGFFSEEPYLPNASEALYDKALKTVQDLDPAGVGARDLRESLLLQLRREGNAGSLAELMVLHRWDALVHHRYADAARTLGVSEKAVAAAAHHISRLNPDPGSSFARAEDRIIEPDVLVVRKGEELSVRLTGEHVPRLTLSSQYREMLAEHGDNAELRRYLSTCFREGRELIQAIEKRQQTILAVANVIVRKQRDFFLRGAAHLLPLKMEDVAADAGLHVSTVSRAVNGKYLRCSHGVYELRSFFSAALPAAEGADVSAAAICSRIRALIAAEDPRKPLSDAKLEKLLADEGMQVARRTIAKYRDRLRLLPASLRKRA